MGSAQPGIKGDKMLTLTQKTYFIVFILLFTYTACECFHESILKEINCPKGPQRLVISEVQQKTQPFIITHVTILGHHSFLCKHIGNTLIISAHGKPVTARWTSVRSVEVTIPYGADVLFQADQAMGIKININQKGP